MSSHVIVTAASASYFYLVEGLIRSLRAAGVAEGAAGDRSGPTFDVKLIDLGLEADQAERLSQEAEVVRQIEPPLALDRPDHSRAFLLSRSVRAFLPDYFPNYTTYVWLDADTWLQRSEVLGWLLAGAAERGLALVPSLHPAYSNLYDKSSLHYTWMQSVYQSVYGPQTAESLQFLPVLNSGVFAATADSPIWAAFADYLLPIFGRSDQVRDQPALNAAVYLEKIPFSPLPAICNWLCVHALPRWDRQADALTEPLPPYQPLQVLHLTAGYAGRSLPIADAAGTIHSCRLDYSSFRAGRRST